MVACGIFPGTRRHGRHMIKNSYWMGGALVVLALAGIGFFMRLNSGGNGVQPEPPPPAPPAREAPMAKADDTSGSDLLAAKETESKSPPAESSALKMTQAMKDELFAEGNGSPIHFALPAGGHAAGRVEMIRQENGRTVMVQGSLTAPRPGRFFFQRQSTPSSMVGTVVFDEGDVAYSVEPGADGTPELRKKHADEVFSRNYTPAPSPAAR